MDEDGHIKAKNTKGEVVRWTVCWPKKKTSEVISVKPLAEKVSPELLLVFSVFLVFSWLFLAPHCSFLAPMSALHTVLFS
jgi:hypothetical protein